LRFSVTQDKKSKADAMRREIESRLDRWDALGSADVSAAQAEQARLQKECAVHTQRYKVALQELRAGKQEVQRLAREAADSSGALRAEEDALAGAEGSKGQKCWGVALRVQIRIPFLRLPAARLSQSCARQRRRRKRRCRLQQALLRRRRQHRRQQPQRRRRGGSWQRTWRRWKRPWRKRMRRRGPHSRTRRTR